MKFSKNLLLRLILIVLLAATALMSSGCVSIRLENSKAELSNFIEQGKLDELTLTIYYMKPNILTAIPVYKRDLIKEDHELKVTISGVQLRENINLVERLANATLEPVSEQGSDGFARIYYVLETKYRRNIFDVCLWNGMGDIFVNGVEVEEQDVFYDVLRIFLPANRAEELERYLKYGLGDPEGSLYFDSNVESVNDEETAIEVAEQVWEMQFDEDTFNDIKNRQPYLVYYYPESDYWLVRAHTGQNRNGDAYALIGSNGIVYSSWIWED